MAGQKIKGVIKDGGWKRIHPGDFAISGMNAHLGGMGVSDSLGKCSPIYLILVPRTGTNAHFVAHALRHVAHVGALKSYVNTIRFNSADFKHDALKLFRLSMPEAEEQAAIVRFLDHASRRIDRFIRAKRKLIAILNEQKQSIVQRAVTQGLDTASRLVDSGVDWLGRVPSHWTVQRIKYVLREVDARSATGKETLLSMRMHHGIVPFAEHFSRPPQATTLVGYKVVRPGQIVINRMQAGNGLVFASGLHGLVSPDYAVLDPLRDLNVAFLGELFRCRKVRTKFRAESKGLGTGTSGFLRLYNDRLGAIHIALPSRGEQDAILQGLAVQLEELNSALIRADRQIALIREYRTRLIADVVTGQLDVRAASAHLPASEPDEPALVDVDVDPADDEDPTSDADDLDGAGPA